MLIKKYTAQTEQEALEKAKAELGKDVIITHIRSIKPNGLFKLFKKPSVEVTASVDDNQVYTKKPVSTETPGSAFSAKLYSQGAGDFVRKNNSAIRDGNGNAVDKPFPIEQVLDGIQNMLEKQSKDTVPADTHKAAPAEKEDKLAESPAMTCVKMIYNKLIANEVEEVYANKLISEIEQSLRPDSDVKTILSNVYQKLVLKMGTTKTIELEEGKTKYIFFIGPTGVGKTTTIAKLASSLKFGLKAKVALFTADTYRLAAVEQLSNYASILNLPLKVIYSEADMKAAMSDFTGYDIVLVDTAGRSLKNREQRDDIEKLLAAVPKENRDIYLVLSATTKYKDLVAITEGYSEISDYNLIFTKVDETECIGNILNIKLLTNAPLSYVANGQNVPNDIQKINPQSIAKALLGGVE